MDQLGIKEKKKMKVNGEWVRMRMSLNYADNTEIKERMGMAKKNDVCRCIARVYRWGALRPHRCSNPVWKDGYCKTHHFARRLPAD